MPFLVKKNQLLSFGYSPKSHQRLACTWPSSQLVLAFRPAVSETAGYSPQLQDPIPELQEVTTQSVIYDLVDVAWFRNLSAPGSTCPWPEELRMANMASWGDG